MQDSERAQEAKCGLCGEPMPEGEEMFKFHGYSGGCPKPPLAEVAKYLGSTLAVDPPPSGASPQAETSEQDVPVLRITVTRDVATEYYAAEFRSADDKVGGMGDYSATPVGALANLCATLIQIDEDNSVERRQPTPVSPVEPTTDLAIIEKCNARARQTATFLSNLEGIVRGGDFLLEAERQIAAAMMAAYVMARPASPVEPELPTRLAICDVCVTAAHCSQHWRCLAECKPNDLRVKTNPCVWRITTGPLGTWVKPTCVEGSIPAPWGTERAKACHLCGAPLKVEREP